MHSRPGIDLAIASRREALDHAHLEAAGIEAVLQLYGPERDPTPFPFAKEVLQLFFIDGEPIPPELLRQGVAFLRNQRAQGRKVLVTCGAGASRSPTFAAACLHEEGMELLDALAAITRTYPRALPHPELLRSLVAYYRLPITAEALLAQLVKARRRIREEPP